MGVVVGTPYATRTDLANLGVVGAALASVPTPTQDAVLSAASAVVDSFLQGRYILPLLQWGGDLSRATAIIAAYDIMTSRGYNPMAGADQNIRQRYLDTLAWLKSVRENNETPSSIVDSSTSVPGDGSSEPVEVQAGGFQLETSPVRGWSERGRVGASNFHPSDGSDL